MDIHLSMQSSSIPSRYQPLIWAPKTVQSQADMVFMLLTVGETVCEEKRQSWIVISVWRKRLTPELLTDSHALCWGNVLTQRLEEGEETHPWELRVGSGEGGPDKRGSRTKGTWPGWGAGRLGEGQRREIRPGEKQRERSVPPGGPRTGRLHRKYRGSCFSVDRGTVGQAVLHKDCSAAVWREEGLKGRVRWEDSSAQVTDDCCLQRQEVRGFERGNEGWVLEKDWKWAERPKRRQLGGWWAVTKQRVVSSKGGWTDMDARNVSVVGLNSWRFPSHLGWPRERGVEEGGIPWREFSLISLTAVSFWTVHWQL